MNNETVSNTVTIQKEPDILIVRSDNMAVFEQQCFLDEERHIVLICTHARGFVAVGKRTIEGHYFTLKRWVITYPGSVSFTVPSHATYKIEMLSRDILELRYLDEQACWKAISRTTRYDGVLPVTRGNT